MLTGWLKRSSSNQEAINVWLLAQILAVLLTDTATVDDSGLLSGLRADLGLQPVSNSSVDFLCLLSRSNFSSANSPNWLVSNNYLRPVGDLILDSLQLRSNDINGLVALSLFQCLAAAENNADSAVESGLGLGCNELVVFL